MRVINVIVKGLIKFMDTKFGKIKEIKVEIQWDLNFIKNELSVGIILAKFPTKIIMTVEYEEAILEWECFETEEWLAKKNSGHIHYTTLVNDWANTLPNNVQKTTNVEIYYKEMYGLKFYLSSLSYKTNPY
jgi:hypothetical protein